MNLALIRQRLAAHHPRRLHGLGGGYAAVAMILCGEPERLETLLIERAERVGDPWSGQMAFPGGRCEADDRDPKHTAERETDEEITVNLADAEYLGRLDDQHGRVAEIIVHCFVYHHPQPHTRINHEVRAVHRVSLAELGEAQRRVVCRPLPTLRHDYPGIRIDDRGERVVWGLTYRFIEELFELCGRAKTTTL